MWDYHRDAEAQSKVPIVKRKYNCFILFPISVICLLLGGCGVVTPRPTQVTPINQAQAFDAAIQGCQRGHIRQIDLPRPVEAQLMGFKQAESILNCPKAECSQNVPTLDPAEAIVWLVTLEGRWQLVGGPMPPPTPTGYPLNPTSTPSYFRHCRTIVDAVTGVAGPEQLFGP